jgi:hypothetical protein
MSETVCPPVSEHARERFTLRSDAPGLTVETAWDHAHPIPGGRWLDGDRARYDPVSRCVLIVRDDLLRTAIYAPTAKPGIQRAVRQAGWSP